jgi:hypothetical protein
MTVRLDASGLVRDNFVLGPGDVGIRAVSDVGKPWITGNTVRGERQGIETFGSRAEYNLVQQCSGTGITATVGRVAFNTVEDCGEDGIAAVALHDIGPDVDAAYNVIRRCAGNGIDGSSSTRGNRVESVGLSGIHAGTIVDSNFVRSAGSHGIWLEGEGSPQRNVVLAAGGDGIRCQGLAEGNVVGRCVGTGIVAASASGNTSYLNRGSGYEVAGNQPVSNNIAFRNVAYGLVWTGEASPSLQCNDWFANVAGANSGTSPGQSDVSIDPLFCDVDRDTVTLMSDSPLLDAAGCGLIGALGEGCIDVPTATLDPGAGDRPPASESLRLALMPPTPNPAVRDVSIAFTLPRELDVNASVLDVSGRRVASLVRDRLGPGRHEVHWTPGRPGAYFVRMEADGQRLTQRLHVLR